MSSLSTLVTSSDPRTPVIVPVTELEEANVFPSVSVLAKVTPKPSNLTLFATSSLVLNKAISEEYSKM
ncbi:hypothetical protein D3C74_264290 [compost metagenome]